VGEKFIKRELSLEGRLMTFVSQKLRQTRRKMRKKLEEKSLPVFDRVPPDELIRGGNQAAINIPIRNRERHLPV